MAFAVLDEGTAPYILALLMLPLLWASRQLRWRGLESLGRAVALALLLWTTVELGVLTLLEIGVTLLRRAVIEARLGADLLLAGAVLLTALAPAAAGAMLVSSLETARRAPNS